MNQIELVKRGARLAWRHRILWLFGFLLSLVGSIAGVGYQLRDAAQTVGFFDQLSAATTSGASDLLSDVSPAGLCGCLLFVVVGGTIFMYVVRAALVCSSDPIARQSAGGIVPTWREGLRLGWSGRTTRLFTLELLVGILVGIVSLLLVGIGGAPLFLLRTGAIHNPVVGIGATIILGLLMLVLLVALWASYFVVSQFWTREVLLADRSIGESIFGSIDLVRSRLKDVVLMALLLLGSWIATTVIVALLNLAAVAIAGLIVAALGFSPSAIGSMGTLASLSGLALFFLIANAPTSLISGFYSAFEATVWSMTYRKVTGEASAPVIEASEAQLIG